MVGPKTLVYLITRALDPQSKDNADVPSWVPGLPGIDPGTIHFTYAKATDIFMGFGFRVYSLGFVV